MKLASVLTSSILCWLMLGLCATAGCSEDSEGTAGDGDGASGTSAAAGGGGGSGGSPDHTPVGGTGAAGSAGVGGSSGAGGSAGDVQSTGGQSGDSGAGEGGATDGGSGQGGASGGEPDSGAIDPNCAGDSEADFALVGWATEAGGTTGGKGGTTITVSNGAELAQALKDKQDSATPLTILVSGTITEANAGVDKIDVKDVQDVSILGTGGGAEFDGIGLKIVRASNIVVRNLKIHNVLSGDKDAISIEGPADHIWIDHCELYAEYQGVDKDYYDGLLDVKSSAQYLTYSWNFLHDSWKTGLVGSSESDTFDRKLTIHHNYYDNCNSRLPLFRGGNGHVFNNYYSEVADTAINSRLGACLRIEANYFEGAHNPWVSAYSDALGGAELSCNVLDDSDFEYADDVHEPTRCDAVVPYDYAAVLSHPSSVPDVVKNNAGVGKLTDPTQF